MTDLSSQNNAGERVWMFVKSVNEYKTIVWLEFIRSKLYRIKKD